MKKTWMHDCMMHNCIYWNLVNCIEIYSKNSRELQLNEVDEEKTHEEEGEGNVQRNDEQLRI